MTINIAFSKVASGRVLKASLCIGFALLATTMPTQARVTRIVIDDTKPLPTLAMAWPMNKSPGALLASWTPRHRVTA